MSDIYNVKLECITEYYPNQRSKIQIWLDQTEHRMSYSSTENSDEDEEKAPQLRAPEADLESDLDDEKGDDKSQKQLASSDSEPDAAEKALPASSKGKRPMKPTSTNQPKGSSSKKQEERPSTETAHKKKRKSEMSPKLEQRSPEDKHLMPPPPKRKKLTKLTTEQVVKVFILSR